MTDPQLEQSALIEAMDREATKTITEAQFYDFVTLVAIDGSRAAASDAFFAALPDGGLDVERLTDSLILAGVLTPKIGYKQTAIKVAAEYARLTKAAR
jgi:hypothetical protein